MKYIVLLPLFILSLQLTAQDVNLSSEVYPEFDECENVEYSNQEQCFNQTLVKLITANFQVPEIVQNESYKGQLTIIERGKMEEMLKEQAFQQTGCVSSECAVEVGKMLGVQNIITGSISRVGTIYSISARAFSVASGEVIKTAVYDHSGDIGGLLTQGMRKVAEELGK